MYPSIEYSNKVKISSKKKKCFVDTDTVRQNAQIAYIII